MGGLQKKLGMLVKRSVEQECMNNDGGKWREQYKYIVREAARAQRKPEDGDDAHGDSIIFDEGHDGLSLDDFRAKAAALGVQLSRVEVGVLRMYTADFFRPWNSALRGLGADQKPDGGKGLQRWATCISVLYEALIVLSFETKKDLTVWRYVASVCCVEINA